MATTTTKTINGVNVEDLLRTIDAIKVTPGIAQFRFRLANEWLTGGHNRSTVNNFYGAFEDVDRERTFVLDADEPTLLLGEDNGPNPAEYLLKALAACVTTAMVYHAAARGIEILEVESTVTGTLDLRGFLGVDGNVRNGYEQIRMNFKIRASATDAEFERLWKLGPAFSPVYDSITQGVPVTVTAERM
jgi:uncharacterized OsmC-like protein